MDNFLTGMCSTDYRIQSHLRHVSEKMFQTKHSSSLHVEILEEDKKTMQEQINSLEEEKARHEVSCCLMSLPAPSSLRHLREGYRSWRKLLLSATRS